MTRPASYRDVPPARRCQSCMHYRLLEYRREDLCFHGDAIVASPGAIPGTEQVILNGTDVASLNGQDYSEVWAGRVINADIGVCDCWQEKV